MTLIFLNGLAHIGDTMTIKIGMKLNKDDAASHLELGCTVIGVLDTTFTIYWIKLNKNTLPRFLNAVEEDHDRRQRHQRASRVAQADGERQDEGARAELPDNG